MVNKMKKIKTLLFYIASFTWGILMSLVACIIFLFLMICGKKPERFHNRIFIKVGKNWGGLELGPWFLTDSSPSLHIKQHESGHGIQNIILGPFMPLIVCLPSAARYWLYQIEKDIFKVLYCFGVVVFIVLISCSFLIPGIIHGTLWAIITGSIVLALALYMLVWLCIIELPKFLNNNSPRYDDAWFEGWATRLGQKYYN